MFRRLTVEEADALEREMLCGIAFRYGRVQDNYKLKHGGKQTMATKQETAEALAPSAENLIRIKQLPIIEEQLRGLKETIEQRTKEAMSMVCTDETVQAVKGMRADLNRQFGALEDVRKAVKKQIMEPYDKFEEVYKECVTDLFKRADADLGRKIADTETEIKNVCEQNLRAYFAELIQTREGVEWLEYERAGVKVDMASAKAKTPKKLMDMLKLFVDGVAQSVKTIEGMDDAAEIMVEYKASLDMGQSIATVQARHKQAEAERQAAEERARAAAEREADRARAVSAAAPAPASEAYSAPKAVQQAAVKTYQLDLRVTGTLDQMKLIKKFLTENGYNYTSLDFKEI